MRTPPRPSSRYRGADGEVDFYTAIAANKQVTVKVGKSGTYTVTFISP